MVYRKAKTTLELKKIKAHYLNPVEKEIYETLTEIMDNTGIYEFFFTNGNLKTLLERNKAKVSKGELTHIIKNEWKLQPIPNASGYTTYLYDKNKDKSYYIYLEELNIHPEHLKEGKLTSKGFYDEVTVQDFPLRGKACFLKIRRRKWLNEETGKNVGRDWNLVAEGTRMTGEFALFLKRNDWIRPL